MGMKLRRNQYSVFRKRNSWLPILGWTLAAVAVVALGFFGASLLDRTPPTDGAASSAPADTDPTPSGTTTTTTQPAQPTVTQPQAGAPIRGFYLPTVALRDTAALTNTLTAAAQAGFNSVVFDLKDSDGGLHYRFTAAMAQQANAYTADALTGDELQAALAAIRGAGMQAIPRLYAFRDHVGAKALPAARISLQGNSGWTWYDNDPGSGGKAWLNPYADEAHSYILQLATELQQAGVTAILLDGVQFPTQTSSASFGSSSNTSLSRDGVLALFIQKMRQALKECPVILGCPAEAALGLNTTVYGNNPLTFAPTMAAPTILPGSLPAAIRIGETVITNTPDAPQQTVQALVGQMVLRTKVIAEDRRPTLLPWLQAEGYTADQILQEMRGCTAGGATQYILYHPAGTYDFAQLAE